MDGSARGRNEANRFAHHRHRVERRHEAATAPSRAGGTNNLVGFFLWDGTLLG